MPRQANRSLDPVSSIPGSGIIAYSDNIGPRTLQKLEKNRRWATRLVPALLAPLACTSGDPEAPAATATATTGAGCGEAGYLATTLVGAVEADIGWEAADLACEGMPRPDGAGARLRFAGNAGERPIAIIIAMPGLERDRMARELESNVTLIEEGAGRFFSTASNDVCWTDVTELERDPAAADRYAIGGTLYCVAPLIEVNGTSSVTLSELRFRGRLDWSAS